jgi:hypothetical protein
MLTAKDQSRLGRLRKDGLSKTGSFFHPQVCAILENPKFDMIGRTGVQ